MNKRSLKLQLVAFLCITLGLGIAFTLPVHAETTADKFLDAPLNSQTADFFLGITAVPLRDDQRAMAKASVRKVEAFHFVVASNLDSKRLELQVLRFAVDGVVLKVVPRTTLPYEMKWDFGPLGGGTHRVDFEVLTESGLVGSGSVDVSA